MESVKIFLKEKAKLIREEIEKNKNDVIMYEKEISKRNEDIIIFRNKINNKKVDNDDNNKYIDELIMINMAILGNKTLIFE